MKVLQIIDVKGWAIDSLAQSIIKHNPHIEFRVLYIPPRGVDEHLAEFKATWEWADIIHFQYWRTYLQIIEKVPEIKKKKLLLTHHNEKNLLSGDWQDVNTITVPTSEAFKKMIEKYPADYSDADVQAVFNKFSYEQLLTKYPEGKLKLIPYGIDLKKFAWNDDYPPKETKIGYVGRIKRWKRLKPIALACQELRYKLMVMGSVDDGEYFKEIVEAMGGEEKMNDTIEWHIKVSDEERLEVYKQMTVYVGNSWDGRETGTLPYLEAMAVGVPVLTTPSGIARDLARDGENCILLEFNNPDPKNNPDWEKKNQQEIKVKLKQMVEDLELRKKLRHNGWMTVKNMPEEKMARQYSMLYNQMIFGKIAQASVIIPATYDRANQVQEILEILQKQNYPNIEAIIVWDEHLIPSSFSLPINFGRKWLDGEYTIPIKFLKTNKEGYNLAMARNIGAIEAEGEILVFCDSRLAPEPDGIAEFVKAVQKNRLKWYFGDKGGGKRSFVENWSAINRQIFINAGMFNERIDKYGGMSQECRERFLRQGIKNEYLESAKAKEIKSAGKWDSRKRSDIAEMKLKLWKMGI